MIKLWILQIETFASYDEREFDLWVHSHRKIQIYDCDLSRAVSEKLIICYVWTRTVTSAHIEHDSDKS